MIIKNTNFYPFYDRNKDSGWVGYISKAAISLAIGSFYIIVQYLATADSSAFFGQYSWVLGAIISTAIMALYIATDVFRVSLGIVNKFEGNDKLSNHIVRHWLSDSQYGLAGLFVGAANVAVAHFLGIPGEFHSTALSLSMMYFGFFVAGFTAGLGALAIVAVIALYLKLAPNLQHALDPNDSDGNGGIKKLGDSLWFFAVLIALVGVLVSVYMFGVKWQYMHIAYVRWIFVLWISFPYLAAISVVLIPGLAVRRHVSYYKVHRETQLKQTKAELYSSFKQFEDSDDESIIKSKKEISEKLSEINDQMEKLRKMRNSHIDPSGDS